MASQYAPGSLLASIRQWQVWTLRPAAKVYVFAVLGLDFALTAAVLAIATPRLSLIRLGVYLALVACAVITVEFTRNIREVRGTVYRDLLGVWFLTIAILFPPGFALLAPLLINTYRLLRIPRMLPYRRVFSGATISLAYGAASVLFHAVMTGTAPRTGAHAAAWLVLAAGCAVLASGINLGLVLAAQRIALPEVPARDALGGLTELISDVVEASLSVMVAFVAAIDPVVILLVPFPLVLGQRYLMNAQLVSRPQVDAQSGVLTAVIWRYQADIEGYWAQHTHTPLSVVLAEIDNFSSIGETAGPAAAGPVLRAVAAILAEKLPAAAQVGRLRGAGFAIVLPGLGEDEARRWAVWIRDQIFAESVDTERGDQTVFIHRPTVSVGVAGQTDFGKTMTELIAMADAALTRAKASGGNQVRVAA